MEQRYGRKNIQRLVEDAFSEEWLTDNAKKCPQCRAHIQVCLLCVVVTVRSFYLFRLLMQ